MICPECRMDYVPNYDEDEKEHKKYHDKIVNGIYAPEVKSDKVVWHEDNYRITVVNYISPLAQKKRAEETGLIANKDTHFDFVPYYHKEALDERNIHLFLLFRESRIIGLLIIERRDSVKQFSWAEYETAAGSELPKGEAVWSIGLIWVHHKYRKQGLGSKLVQVAASFFGIMIQSIGWYTPFTNDGKQLAKSLCIDSFLVAK